MTPVPIEFPVEGLCDDVVRLRLIAEGDLPALIDAVRDPAVSRYTSIPSPYGEREAHEWLGRTARGLAAGGDLHPVMVDASSDELLGAVGIAQRPGDPGRWAVGYWVAVAHRGRGLAARGLRLLCAFAFSKLAVARIELCAEPENVASQRTAERCGFTREGLLRSYLEISGGRRDMLMYSLLPGDEAAGASLDGRATLEG